jgi:predicted  nucleic acid-binding Zn-ribbon protein
LIQLHNKFIKDKEALEYRIKEFKDEKKSFEYTYNSFNERINTLNSESSNLKKEKENFSLNKALFSMINTNLQMGHTNEQIDEKIKSKYIDKNYITIPTKVDSRVFKKEKVDNNRIEKVIYTNIS